MLVDSEPAHRSASRRLVEPEQLTDEEYAHFAGASLEWFTAWVRERYGLAATEAESAARYSALVVEELAARPLPPLDGALALIEVLRVRGLPLALASQSLPAWVAETLRGAGLEAAFDVVVAGDAVARGKPAPDIYLHTASLLGAPPAACLVFEDSHYGILAARAAGMTVVQTRQASSAIPPHPEAHAVIASLREFDIDVLGRSFAVRD